MINRLNKRCPNCGSTVLKTEMLSNGLFCYECTKCGQAFEIEDGDFEKAIERADDDYLFWKTIDNTENQECKTQLNLHRKVLIVKQNENLTVKKDFHDWLLKNDGKTEASANNYICGFKLAQRHYCEYTQTPTSFYDIDDIRTLQNIFNKYIDGEYSEIGKKYSGAVRASLKAYLRFFQQRNIDNCDFPSDTSVPKAILHKKNGENIEIREKHDDKKEIVSFPQINIVKNNQPNLYYKKAFHKIRKWAYSPEQQNHKLIKSYFKAYHMFEEPPTKRMLQKICGDASTLDFYVRDFVGTYNSLKVDGVTTNGKIFEDDGERIQIWEEIKDELLKYEKYFYNPKNN